MGKLTPEERPIMGKLVNEVRDILEEEFNKKEKRTKIKRITKKTRNRKYRCYRTK